jgi:hypothetical protein
MGELTDIVGVLDPGCGESEGTVAAIRLDVPAWSRLPPAAPARPTVLVAHFCGSAVIPVARPSDQRLGSAPLRDLDVQPDKP